MQVILNYLITIHIIGFLIPMKDKSVYAIVLFVFVLIGIIGMIFSTTWGIGISTDSIIYIGVARNLLAGKWFATAGGAPMTHYPPLYPLLLSISGFLEHDIITWRWYLPKKNELEENLPLKTLYNGPDGSVYKIIEYQMRNH